MSFSEAYNIANIVRSELGQNAEISNEDLTSLVAEVLEKENYLEELERYKLYPLQQEYVTVISRDEEPAPFSKAILAQSLEICAFPKEECFNITVAIEQQLLADGITELPSIDLARITHDYLAENEPPEMVERYRSWIAFSRDTRPLVLLIGGTTGSGKSTISSDIAHRLSIVRTQSTDMLREVMRLLLPERLMPELHASSFNAWKTLPSWDDKPTSFESHFIEGYLAQARGVGLGLEGVLNRAEREQLSVILEGVHIFPAMQRQLAEGQQTIVVPAIVAVLKKKQLRKQLEGRGRKVSKRRAERYLASFEAIWELQSFLVSEANSHQIPIIPNVDIPETIQLVMDTIAERLLKEYPVSPEDIFPTAEPHHP